MLFIPKDSQGRHPLYRPKDHFYEVPNQHRQQHPVQPPLRHTNTHGHGTHGSRDFILDGHGNDSCRGCH